jgi:hypothetical protein
MYSSAQIITLHQMLNHDAAAFHALSQKLVELHMILSSPDDHWKEEAGAILREVRQRCEDLDIDQLTKFLDRLEQKVDSASEKDCAGLLALATELNDQFEDGLKLQVFLLIPRIEKHWYEQCPLDHKALKKFPKAGTELSEAGKCLALDRYAASVYHSMRSLEYGLQSFASSLSIRYANQEWGSIIDLVEKKINALKVLRRGTRKARIQHFCSEAAKEFRYFKDAWRNYAMHVRQESYDREEALRVYQHVSDFVSRLSGELDESHKVKFKVWR